MPDHSKRRINFILSLLEKKQPKYLEIGVETGYTFFGVEAVDKTAVDPSFLFDVDAARHQEPESRFIQSTSDDFFQGLHQASPFDVVFLDGLHTWDQTYRDFCNALLVTHEKSVIVIDDTYPSDVFSCNRDQFEALMMRRCLLETDDNLWHGDTYRVVPMISLFHPSLSYCTLISDGNPQTIVWRSKERVSCPFDLIDSQGGLNIAALDYLWFVRHQTAYNLQHEAEGLALVARALRGDQSH